MALLRAAICGNCGSGSGGGGSSAPAGAFNYTTAWTAADAQDAVADLAWAGATGSECHVMDAADSAGLIRINPQFETDGSTAVGTNRVQGVLFDVPAGDVKVGFEIHHAVLAADGVTLVNAAVTGASYTAAFFDGQAGLDVDDWYGYGKYLSADVAGMGDSYYFQATSGDRFLNYSSFLSLSGPTSGGIHRTGAGVRVYIEREGTDLRVWASTSGGLDLITQKTVGIGVARCGIRIFGFSGETDKMLMNMRAGILSAAPWLG